MTTPLAARPPHPTFAIVGHPNKGKSSIVATLAEDESVSISPDPGTTRVARSFRFDRYRIQGFADIFNVLNSGTVIRVNETYGTNPATNQWMTPLGIMEARYLRFGVQMSF